MPTIDNDKKKVTFEVVEAMIAVGLKKLIAKNSKADKVVAVAGEPHVIAVQPMVNELRIGTQAKAGVVVRIGNRSDSARRARARLSNLGLSVAQLPEQKRRAIAKSQQSISEARLSAEMHEGQLRIN